MFTHRSLFGLLVLFLFVNQAAFSKAGSDRGVKFISGEITLTAEVGHDFIKPLRELLSDEGTGNLTWGTMDTPPSWLNVDLSKERMSGKPKDGDVGSKAFRLSVQDDDTGAVARIVVNVIYVPSWNESPLNLGQQPEDVLFQLDLKTKITYKGSGTLTFSVKDQSKLPKWMTLAPNGLLSGTPDRTDVGKYSGITFVVTSSEGGTPGETPAYGEVTKKIKCPKWTSNPLPIDDAKEDFPYNKDVSGNVSNPEHGALNFTLVTGAPSNWVSMSLAGVLSGTPKKVDVGPLSLVARVSSVIEGQTCENDTTLTLAVKHTNHKPRWTQDPVVLPDALTGKAYSQNLKPFTEDPDGDPLTFGMVRGPDWAKISKDGILSGTPEKQHVGVNQWTVEITDGEFSASAVVKVKVIKANEPPVWVQKPTLLPDAKEDTSYSQNLIYKVVDPDNDPLTFTVISGPNWATVTPQGMLSGTPGAKDVGMSTFRIKVADNISGEDVADVKINVVHTNHPPEWTQNPIKFSSPEKVAIVKDLAPYAKDIDTQDKLKFLRLSGPAWGQVSSDGKLTGTPSAKDLGDNTFKVRVDDQAGGTADVDVIATITNINDPPYWTQEPVVLPSAPEKQPYSASVAPFAKDDDPGDTLTFSKISGPAWASVSAAGDVTGTPSRPDVGLNKLVVRVTDKAGSFDDAEVHITITKVNTPPRWLQNPIALDIATEDLAFSFTVAGFATDDDNDLLTFSKKSGPDWLTVDASGMLGGTPAHKDIGDYVAVIVVSDGQASAETNASGKVVEKNYPPTIHQDNLKFTVKERESFKENLNQAKYVEDKNGDTLVFTLLDSATWVQLSSNGELFINPLHPQLGAHVLKFRVSDGKLNSDAFLNITVIRDPRPPVWSENPIKFTATSRVLFRASVADKAKDLDGVPLTFSKKSGPDWLTVDSNGAIHGTPMDPNIGENTFVVTATNDALGTDVNVIITVLQGNKDPYWTQDPIVLPNGTVSVPYKQSVAQYAKEPDNEPLTFSKVDGPAWINVSTNGMLIGTPAASDVGLNSFKVRAEDPHGAYADVTVEITVEKFNHPPKWLQDPIKLTDAYSERAYAFDLAPLATDEDNDKLTFTKISGPDWLQVAANGAITGMPQTSDIGSYTAVFEVTDGRAKAQANAVGRVLRKNDPPTINVENMIFTVKERQTYTVSLNDPKYVFDPDGDPLTFALIDTAPWITLTPQGELTLKPLHINVGEHAFKFKVSDGIVEVQGIITVKVLRDPQPPKWLEDPIRFQATVKKPFEATVADKVKELDGVPLTFSKRSGPAWLNVDAAGKLTGIPEIGDLGENRFVVSAMNDALGADVNVIITVVPDNKPPYWVEDPINLPDTMTGKTITQNISDKAKDPEGEKLTFEKIDGPDWLFITTSGVIIGTPEKKDVGINTAQVRVMDPWKLYADATVQVLVIDGSNHPPKWTQDPIPLGEAKIDVQFSFDLAKYATDEDNDTLTFKMLEGPTWMTVSSAGKISGIPKKQDIGEFVAKFAVTDNGQNWVPVDAFGKVVDGVNHPPKFTPEALSFIVVENKTLSVNINDPKYISDPDGDKLIFQLIDTVEWITLAENGDLSIKPKHEHLGDHSYQVKAIDEHGASDQASMFVRVIKDENAPIWLEDPIRFDALVNKPFTATIADKAKDPNNKPLTFSKISGPDWLTVSSAGHLGGTPLTPNLGVNNFMVEVTNGSSAAQARLIITVKNGDPIIDEKVVDEAVPGAPAENLWVIDNSWPWISKNYLIEQLSKNIDVFFDTLNMANIHHSGIYLSSDYTKWQRPIKDQAGEYFLSWKDSHVADGFRYRVEQTKTTKCHNSPIWAMFCFYCQVEEKLPEIYNNYFTEAVPMDVLIVSKHKDYYKKFMMGTPQANWTAENFADNFIAFHKKEKQPYRINAIAPECPSLLDPYQDDPSVQSEVNNPYKVLVRRTSGSYYPFDCNIDMEKILRTYAQEVIFRAYVNAKNRIPLSKKPVNPADIKVSIGGTPIAGNTGSEKDLWTYDAARNEVVIRWYLMDLSQIKPGDKIRIEYVGVK